jgi:2-(1,2-epoxy-1,2-dihydrophenyl)acetyl-CoA isomerase
VIAGRSARFGQMHVKRGFSIDLGGTWILPRLVGLHRAKELAFLSDLLIDAEEATEMGLVNRVVDDAKLLDEAKALGMRISRAAPVGIQMAKEGLNRSMLVDLSDALDYEARAQGLCTTTADAREGIAAFKEKRDPEFHGR